MYVVDGRILQVMPIVVSNCPISITPPPPPKQRLMLHSFRLRSGTTCMVRGQDIDSTTTKIKRVKSGMSAENISLNLQQATVLKLDIRSHQVVVQTQLGSRRLYCVDISVG
jgi:hypothetical protein